MSTSTALLLCLICYAIHCALAIRFYLEPGQKRCFTEELPSNTKITGETRVTGGKGDMDIDVIISTMHEHILYHKKAAEHGKFSFDTPIIHAPHEDVDIEDDYEYGEELDDDEEEDTYKVCIEHKHHGSHSPGTRRSIYFNLHQTYGSLDGKTDRSAKATDTDKLQTTMRGMHTTLSGMIGDLSQLQRRERSLTKRMKRTSSRVTILAILSLFVTLATSAIQYRYYKGYFKQKKLC